MIRLRDTICIAVPPERVWSWLNDLPSHYREWHPDHVACRYERGTSLEVGAVLYTEEYLHRKLHRLRLRVTEVVPARLLRYSSRSFRGAFILERTQQGTRFTAELDFGVATPVIASVLDALFRKVLARRLIALQVHMWDEGQNLKRLLEASAHS